VNLIANRGILMKSVLTLVCVLFICSAAAAQDDDLLRYLDKQRVKEDRRRVYRPGEEVQEMIASSVRRDSRPESNPKLNPRVIPITNADVLRMRAEGFSDALMIQAISNKPTVFDTSLQALVDLKRAGISDAVLDTMIAVDAGSRGNLIPLDKDGLPSEVGVYISDGNRLVEMDAEVATWQSGGVVKAIFLPTRGHRNAKIMNPRSRYIVHPSAQFIIRCPEGTAPSEYQLLEMYEKSNRREFRVFTGGVFHRSSGAERTAVPFAYKKIAPRTFLVTLNSVPRGEYGLLPPAYGAGSNSFQIGKVYTFAVD
jgi:hypothetical protein